MPVLERGAACSVQTRALTVECRGELSRIRRPTSDCGAVPFISSRPSVCPSHSLCTCAARWWAKRLNKGRGTLFLERNRVRAATTPACSGVICAETKWRGPPQRALNVLLPIGRLLLPPYRAPQSSCHASTAPLLLFSPLSFAHRATCDVVRCSTVDCGCTAFILPLPAPLRTSTAHAGHCPSLAPPPTRAATILARCSPSIPLRAEYAKRKRVHRIVSPT